MTDADVTRLLRETLQERAAAVDAVAGPLELQGGRGTATRPGRRTGGVLSGVAAVLVVVLAVGAVAAWRSAQRPAQPRPEPAASVPSDWKPVSSLGVELRVPPTWRVAGGDTRCLPGADGVPVVSRPVGATSVMGCARPDPSGTLVEFRSANGSEGAPRRVLLPGGRTEIVWFSPDRRTAVVATGRDGDLLQRVVDTAHPVQVDSFGCATDGARPGWDRPRLALPRVRLDGVTDIVACAYARDSGGYRFVASSRFTADQRIGLLRAVLRAPAGAAPDATGDCPRDDPEQEYVLLRVTDQAGTFVLAVHYRGCRDRYLAGATSQSAMTAPLVTAVGQGLGAFLSSMLNPMS